MTAPKEIAHSNFGIIARSISLITLPLGVFFILFTIHQLFITSPETVAEHIPTSAPEPERAMAKKNLPPLDVPSIAGMNLFGKLEAGKTIDLTLIPSTTLNLKLVGIIGSTKTTMSRALIIVDNAAGKAYHQGDALPDGTMIHTIERDTVLIQRAEQLEKITLYKAPETSSSQRKIAASQTPQETANTSPSTRYVSHSSPSQSGNPYESLERRLKSIRQNPKINHHENPNATNQK